ncbi:major capsid protein [Spartinivicinus poritis]|uniref:Major capsid protein n=1 Tax=Spartinivicinus poritis TaxID=2994640 RepID=A0ABT5UKM7_9GAMM|nr:major capsid protein [Spartinivicinus sp. A2-2]MDE1465928.1 major capsid protein [Spartinivicinus sp. A2-2]
MNNLDLIAQHEAFSVQGLTLAINKAVSTPGRIRQLGWFSEEGINTLSINIEFRNQSLILVPTQVRGAPGVSLDREKRSRLPFNIVHLPMEGAVLADEVLGVRAFGSENTLDQIQRLFNRELERMRQSFEVTHEFQRLGAIKGKILDADGVTVLEDLFDRFKIQPNKMTLDFTKDLRTQCMDIKRASEKEQGAIKASRYRVLMGSNVTNELLKNDDFKKAYERWQDGQALRDDMRMNINFGGLIWEECESEFNSQVFIGPDDAIVVPEGLPGLFRSYYGPANYMETVNTRGLPYYAKRKAMDYDKGVMFEAQSNPLHLCTNPRVIIHVKIKKAS